MGTLIDFATRQKEMASTKGKSATITFHSPQFSRDDQPQVVSVTVEAQDGDVFGIWDVVRENGGIWAEQGADFVGFVPWPCAYVEIKFASAE